MIDESHRISINLNSVDLIGAMQCTNYTDDTVFKRDSYHFIVVVIDEIKRIWKFPLMNFLFFFRLVRKLKNLGETKEIFAFLINFLAQFFVVVPYSIVIANVFLFFIISLSSFLAGDYVKHFPFHIFIARINSINSSSLARTSI